MADDSKRGRPLVNIEGCKREGMQRGSRAGPGSRHVPMRWEDTGGGGMRGGAGQGAEPEQARTICWKVEREARMEPPIQTEYLRSGGATTLTFMLLGARAVISLFMRSAMAREHGRACFGGMQTQT